MSALIELYPCATVDAASRESSMAMPEMNDAALIEPKALWGLA
jgi:hypothetical protein